MMIYTEFQNFSANFARIVAAAVPLAWGPARRRIPDLLQKF